MLAEQIANAASDFEGYRIQQVCNSAMLPYKGDLSQKIAQIARRFHLHRERAVGDREVEVAGQDAAQGVVVRVGNRGLGHVGDAGTTLQGLYGPVLVLTHQQVLVEGMLEQLSPFDGTGCIGEQDVACAKSLRVLAGAQTRCAGIGGLQDKALRERHTRSGDLAAEGSHHLRSGQGREQPIQPVRADGRGILAQENDDPTLRDTGAPVARAPMAKLGPGDVDHLHGHAAPIDARIRGSATRQCGGAVRRFGVDDDHFKGVGALLAQDGVQGLAKHRTAIARGDHDAGKGAGGHGTLRHRAVAPV